ncbi:MAG: DUF2442 domain-containing protein [Pseudomonadota bacterium]
MSASRLGSESLGAEVTNISEYGLWILVGDEELFLSHEDFPWFKSSSVQDVLNVELLSPAHLYWPGLDADISTDSIKEPDGYPLKAGAT